MLESRSNQPNELKYTICSFFFGRARKKTNKKEKRWEQPSNSRISEWNCEKEKEILPAINNY